VVGAAPGGLEVTASGAVNVANCWGTSGPEWAWGKAIAAGGAPTKARELVEARMLAVRQRTPERGRAGSPQTSRNAWFVKDGTRGQQVAHPTVVSYRLSGEVIHWASFARWS